MQVLTAGHDTLSHVQLDCRAHVPELIVLRSPQALWVSKDTCAISGCSLVLRAVVQYGVNHGQLVSMGGWCSQPSTWQAVLGPNPKSSLSRCLFFEENV